jgi:anti-sigma B factor antagonist
MSGSGDPRAFFLSTRDTDGTTHVRIGGECDAGTFAELDAALNALSAGSRDVLVDLAAATFVDSMTLGSLTAAAKRVRADGRSFSVVGAHAPEVKRAFEVAGLDRYLL